jgi:hypothetical protein
MRYPQLKTIQRRFDQLMKFMETFNAHNPPQRNFVWADMRHWHFEICLATEPIKLKEMLILESRTPTNYLRDSPGFQSLLAVMVGARTFWICADCSYPMNFHDHGSDGCPNCGDTFPDRRRRIQLK